MDIERIIQQLRFTTQRMEPPASQTLISRFGRDPFLVLIGCILSLRTKDTVSLPAACRLFEHARTPQSMLALSYEAIASIIYPVGFYRRKAITIHKICVDLLNHFNGVVPSTREELMSFYGVGLKTANLVLSEGFEIPALCVDTHVHRISNRLGVVATKTPEETEAALRLVIPQKYWIEWTKLLVMLGQNTCLPISPKCSKCPVMIECKRIGVTRAR